MLLNKIRGAIPAVVLFSLLTIANISLAQEGFTTVMEFGAKGDYQEQKISSSWHRNQPTVGGLGFEVLVGDWPRLLQRGELDVYNSTNNRQIFDIVTYQDLGQIRLAKQKVKPKLAANSWCHRKYEMKSKSGTLEMIISRLTPAVWLETENNSLELFAGTKRGNRKPNDMTEAVPGYVAFVENGKVVVRDTNHKVELADMDEPWMLFFFGKKSYLTRTSIPNVLARIAPISSYLKDSRLEASDFAGFSESQAQDILGLLKVPYLQASDLPVLIVLQRKAQFVESTPDALNLQFGESGAGKIVLLPLYGSYHPLASETTQWTSSLDGDVVDRCRKWARRAKAMPILASESYKIEEDGDVTVRQEFDYVEIEDQWNSPTEHLAPIPPVISLVRKYGFGVKLSDESCEFEIVTHSGPYKGIPGSRKLEFTIPSLDKYIGEVVAADESKNAAFDAITEELSNQVHRMIEASPLRPADNVIGWMEAHFVNPGQTVLAIAEAIPYLEKEKRREALGFLKEFIAKNDPLTSDGLNNDGNRREYAADDSEDRRTVNMGVRWEDRFNNIYGLWLLSHTTGQWQVVKTRFDQMEEMAAQAANRMDWATCGYFRGPGEDRNNARAHRGEDRGGVWAVNGQFGRWIALARIADHFGNTVTAETARYMLARTGVLRFAHGKLIRYSYDAGLQEVALEPDWMYRLSTSGGNGSGPGLLWTRYWAGAQDDVRAVIRWDEFGPTISQMLNQMWQPVMPHFQDTTPELGRFVGDHLRRETQRYIEAVEQNAPAWYLTRRPAYLGKEMHIDSPRNSLGVFLAKSYVLGNNGEEMAHYQDIPFVRVGDLYHLRRLTANLRCFGGIHWKELKQ